MAHSTNTILEKVYAAQTDEDRRQAYNDWAGQYDRDVTGFGIQLPYVGAAVFARHVTPGTGPILDAGCGTGMHTLPLALMGYDGFHGIDVSDGMLEIARARGIYASLQRMALGSPLDFPDDTFPVTYCIGCLAPGNGPPSSLDELIRVTKPGGLVIWSTHAHENERTEPYHNYRRGITEQGLWTPVFDTGPFVSMPEGDANIQHIIYVFKIAKVEPH